MQFMAILRIFGLLLMLFSLTMLPPIGISFWYDDGGWVAFILGFMVTSLVGFICWFFCRNEKKELKTRDGFLIVALFWGILSIFGAIPLMIARIPSLSFTDAVFETVSGLTTTGATVLLGLEYIPHAILYYRQQLQFLGGMGIIVLAVAILPMLGIGGLQLYRAEIPGPTKDNKLTPRITQTAKALWYIYVGLCVLCAVAYWIAGMTPFNAIGESFATISTGGFSLHDESFGYYNSTIINLIAVFFMFLGGTNFTLHFMAMQRKSLVGYWQDTEFKVYVVLVAVAVLTALVMLSIYEVYPDAGDTLIYSLFNVVSLLTTSGFLAQPISTWPTFLPPMFIMLGLIGACAASTSGGVKIIRLILVYKQGTREIQRLIHPNAVVATKLGTQLVKDDVLQAVWGFLGCFILLFLILTLVLMATGLDLQTAEGAVVSCIANIGLGLGDVANGFGRVNDTSKWVLILAMLIGRLEIFTLLVLLSPEFWRR